MGDAGVVVTVLVAAVLLVAGPSKAAAPGVLADSVVKVSSGRLGAAVARWTVRLLGVLELVVALVLLSGRASLVATIGLGLVGAGIVGFVAAVAARDLTVACGCFGAVGGARHRTLGPQNAIFGLGFVGAAVLIGMSPPRFDSQLALLSALVLALGFVLVTRAAQLQPLFLRGFGRNQ